ncbi:MAG: hypothetical protein J5745_03740 [Bacteroidales bacterium]|nr:hypothetical protein [Bacteroidales bacterium]
MGRILTINTITSRFLCYTRRMSVATAAFLQIPAFFASCSIAPAEERTVRIQLREVQASAVDVFLFDAAEPYLLDSYQQCPGEDCAFVLSGPGEKIVAALPARPGDLYARASVSRLQDLSREVFVLEKDSPQAPLRYGVARIGSGASRSLTLNMNPLICTIRVRSVSCDFGGHSYVQQKFHNDNLFLLNAASESCPLAAEGGHPVSWANYGFPSSEHPYIYAKGEPPATFYCYPNPAAKPPTRLVLEGTVGDVHCYYPIEIPLPRGGMSYDLDITLHRIGTDSPDCTAAPGTYTIEYTTVPWRECEEREEPYSSTGTGSTICLSSKPYLVKSPDPDPVLISDYNILIYNCFGILEESVYVPERELVEEVFHRTTLLKGQSYTILAAANLGYALGVLPLNEALQFRHYLAYPDEYSHGIPMAAVLEGVAATDVITLRLERLMGAVDVRLDRSRLNPDVTLAVDEVCIGKCPMSATLFTTGAAVQFFPGGFSRSGLDLSPLDRGKAVRMYLLENISRDVPSSYVELKCTYSSPRHHTRVGEHLIYRFYIRDGDTYGIGRNTIQSVVVRPSGDGLSGDSWRVDTSGLD